MGRFLGACLTCYSLFTLTLDLKDRGPRTFARCSDNPAYGGLSEIAHRPSLTQPIPQPLELILILLSVIDAEMVQDGRRQIGRCHWFIADIAGVGRGLAVNLAAANAGAGEEGSEGMGPVIAAAILRIAALGEHAETRR